MRVQNAVAAVRAFAAEGELGALAIEFRAPLNQFIDALGGVLHQYFGGFGIAQAIAGLQRVLEVETDFVFVAECGRNAALGPLRIRFSDLALGQHENRACTCQFNRGTQPGNSGANHKEIGSGRRRLHRSKMVSRGGPVAARMITL